MGRPRRSPYRHDGDPQPPTTTEAPDMHSHSRGSGFFLAGFASLALSACGGDSATGPVDMTPVPAAPVQATPSITFAPGAVTVTVGGTVTFDFGSLQHDVFFDNAPPGAPAT